MFKRWLKYSILAVFILTGISLILSFWIPLWQSFRIIFSSVYLLFIPGFIWSFVLWKQNELDVIERYTLSLVLSIAFVPLFIYLLNKVGFKINLINSFFEILVLILFAAVILIIKKYKRRYLIH